MNVKRSIAAALLASLAPFAAHAQSQSGGLPSVDARLTIVETAVGSLGAGLASEKAAREAADAALQGAINTLAAQLATQATKIATLDGTVSTQAAQLAAQAAQIVTLQGAVSTQAAQLATQATQIATLQGEVATAGTSDVYVSGSGHNVHNSGNDGGLIRFVGVEGLDINTLNVPAGKYFLLATSSLYNADHDSQRGVCELLVNGTTLIQVDADIEAVTDWGPSMSDKVSLPDGGTITVRCGGFNLYARPSSRLTALRVDRIFVSP